MKGRSAAVPVPHTRHRQVFIRAVTKPAASQAAYAPAAWEASLQSLNGSGLERTTDDLQDRRHGRLTWFGFGLLVTWFFVPHLAVDFAVRYVSPWTTRQVVGLVVLLLGAGLLVWALLAFRSVKKAFARHPGELTITGPYRWSRNPQYVGWFLFVVGFAVLGWTWRCWIALALLMTALQVLVLVEEEHLRRQFGAAYGDYAAHVPRWLGIDLMS